MRLPLAFLAASLAASLVLPAAGAAAREGCAPDRSCDEAQIGPYVAPAIDPPRPASREDPRGRAVRLPLPLLDGLVWHKPGAGIWLAQPLEGANLYLNAARDRVSVGARSSF